MLHNIEALNSTPRPNPVTARDVIPALVEEQLLKLIIDLNPQLRLQQQLGADSTTANKNSSNSNSGSSLEQEEDIMSEQWIRKLINSLPSSNRNQGVVSAAHQNVPNKLNISFPHRDRLLRLFERYDKYRLPCVGELLRQYRGQEEALLAALVAEYGPEPTAYDADYWVEGTPALPRGWRRMEGSQGDVYYKNVSTGKVQWTRPRSE